MARKKFVAISQKPSVVSMSAGDEIPMFPPDVQALALNPNSPGESSRQTSERLASLNPLEMAIYGSFFCVSYGVVFTALSIGRFMPGSGLIGQGLHDGADAAERSLEHNSAGYP